MQPPVTTTIILGYVKAGLVVDEFAAKPTSYITIDSRKADDDELRILARLVVDGWAERDQKTGEFALTAMGEDNLQKTWPTFDPSYLPRRAKQ
jgi:hypothetical protein